MAKVKVTLSVDETLRNRVAMLAAVEERNFSQMWGVLVGEALADREPSRENQFVSPVSPAVFRENVVSEPDGSAFFPSVPVSAAKGQKPRTKTCVHLIQPDVFCKWGCDSA